MSFLVDFSKRAILAFQSNQAPNARQKDEIHNAFFSDFFNDEPYGTGRRLTFIQLGIYDR